MRAKKNVQKKQCTSCGKIKLISNFYSHNGDAYKLDGHYPVCKTCIKNKLKIKDDTDLLSEDFLKRFQDVLRQMDRPFIYRLYLTSVNEIKDASVKRSKASIFGIYYKNISSMNSQTTTWNDSVFTMNDTPLPSTSTAKKISRPSYSSNSEIVQTEDTPYEIIDNYSKLDAKNKQDVLRMLGYDPFEGENEEDKRDLYNRLVDFLDDSTLEDGFKLQAVISIVKLFNQANKIDKSMALVTNDLDSLVQNSGKIKTLIASKKQLLDSINSLAKDNGISVNNNHSKGKGAGTLSGILRELQDKGFDEAKVNLFDVQTSDAMEQVAEISNKAILSQVKLDENDYTEMLTEARQKIINYQKQVAKLKEENRKLKIEIREYEAGTHE